MRDIRLGIVSAAFHAYQNALRILRAGQTLLSRLFNVKVNLIFLGLVAFHETKPFIIDFQKAFKMFGQITSYDAHSAMAA